MAAQDLATPTTVRPRIGLALGSGAARGWAHIGVLRALGAAGIRPDIVCGTSIGALVGGIHLAGKLDVLEQWARDLTRLKVMSYLDFQMAGGGMIAGNRLTEVIQRHIGDQRIEDLPVPFTCVTTDLVSGHEVWIRQGSLVEALRASISLPGVFSPAKHEDRWLIDGALVNPVPVSVCRALGAHIVIAVNLHSDIIGRTRAPGTSISRAAGFDLLSELPAIERAAGPLSRFSNMLRRIYGRPTDAPSLFGVMVQSLNIVLDRIARSRLAGEPPDVAITPRLGHLGLLEFDRADEAIAEGFAAANRAIPELADAVEVFRGQPA
ncbi:MAG: patatin-like phospholipase family protein [Pseudomonadota bacterium]